jgi:DNA mismatch endonuclease (patch repair protein)
LSEKCRASCRNSVRTRSKGGMDVMTPEQRYRAMAHNRGRTRPERALASALWKKGLRYLTDERYQARYGHRLSGHPDLVFVGCRVVVFVDGCFWHGCSVCSNPPDQISYFWRRKIETNRERNDESRHGLRARAGQWCVFRSTRSAQRHCWRRRQVSYSER